MRKETINKIEQEINQKTILPNNLKETIKKDVFTNIIIAIAMIIYFTFLIMGSVGTVKTVRSIDFNIFSIVLLTVSIYLFEIAYKKDNGKLAIYGIETLIASIITLFFPYIIFELDEFYKKYYMILSAYIGIYYIIKSICIAQRTKKSHIKQSSDIKEIVKKEKRKDVIRVKEKPVDGAAHNDSQKKQTKKLEIANNENKNNVEVPLLGDPEPKKRGRPKKSETTNNENKNNAETITQGDSKPKKRGRPKKIDEEKNVRSEPQKTIEKENIETTPKKRGRPRKVVTAND